MISSPLSLILFLFVMTGRIAVAQSLCDIPKMGGRGLGPPITTDARAVLAIIAKAVPTDPGKFEPWPTSDRRVAQDKHGAAADTCTLPDRDVQYIFYDPAYMTKVTKDIGGSSWGVAFVLAHEAAHHVSFHTRRGNDWDKNQELDADYAAAVWLTRLGAGAADLRNAINALGLSDQVVAGYPTRCERLASVIRGYNDATKGSPEPEPVCDLCAGEPSTSALYARQPIAAGVPFRTSDILKCGIGSPATDLPVVFERDLSGMCAASSMTASTRLTWKNIDVCALMPGRNGPRE